MNSTAKPPLVITVVRIVFLWFTAILASLTLLTFVSQLVGLTFKLYVFFSAGIIVLICGIIFPVSRKLLKHSATGEKSVLIFLLLLAFAGTVLTLVTHHPNMDDYNYVPNAVHYLQNPDEPMNFYVHYLYSETPIESHQAVSRTFEYVSAVIAYFVGAEYLFVYYFLSAGLMGFLIPLVIFYLVFHFSDSTLDAVIGALAAVCILLLVRETVRTFGNFAFLRIFQGKSVCLTVGVPLFAAVSIDFFKTHSLLSWVMLFSTATAMIGTTVSATILMPPLAAMLAIANFSISENKKREFLSLFPYFASLSFVVFYALFILIHNPIDTSAGSSLNVGWPATFWGHALFFVNKQIPVTPIILGVSTVLAGFFLTGKRRRFLLVWIISLFVLFLNPISGSLLIKYITSQNAYWRMFYLFPFPLVVGIAASTLLKKIKDRYGKKVHIITLVVLSFVCVGQYVFSYSSLSHRKLPVKTWIGLPKYKVPEKDLDAARMIIKSTPKGPMLAPPNISGLITMLNSGYPQIVERRGSLVRVCFRKPGLIPQIKLRIYSARFVAGTINTTYFSAFQGLLKQENIRAIVLKKPVFIKPEVKNLLDTHKFLHHKTIEGYEITWK